MPPIVKTNRNDILNAVMAIIDESGWDAVSARSVAAKLNISTQPIYREFADMDEVRNAALGRGWGEFVRFTSGDALDSAAKYVLFACEKSKLFNFLLRGRHYEYDGLDDLSKKLVSEDIIDKLCEITKLPRDKVYRVHLCLWMALHGLAALSADNNMSLGEDEVKLFTKDITMALTAFYRKGVQ